MCPLSLLTRFWIVAFIILGLCRYISSQGGSQWNITCAPTIPTIYVDETSPVACNISGLDGDQYFLQIESRNPAILHADQRIPLIMDYEDFSSASFNLTGIFLGRTSASLKVQRGSTTYYEDAIPVVIIRRVRAIDHVFTGSVATLVAIIYINFGCALNWQEFRQGLRRPIGPAIGFISQFLFMPLLSFGLGRVLFPQNADMQLGMFFTGVAPAGGASNMWALLLGGNIALSITMTAISNIAAFGMMPLWLFTLGKVIFDTGELPVPYVQIMTYALALVGPLLIGFLIQRYLKKVARFLTRILKGFSILLLLFIIIFAIVTNLYLFELFSWQIIVSGLGLPWLGYTLGWIFAKVCRQSSKDALTIAIEAGIQNTGISIFLLRAVLPQPEADLSTVAPVAVATMTPIPLLLLLIYQKINERCKTNVSKEPLQDVEDSCKEKENIPQ